MPGNYANVKALALRLPYGLRVKLDLSFMLKSFFKPNWIRAQADDWMKFAKEGEAIVRLSSDIKYIFTISYKQQREVLHTGVEIDETTFVVTDVSGALLKYSSMSDVLAFLGAIPLPELQLQQIVPTSHLAPPPAAVISPRSPRSPRSSAVSPRVIGVLPSPQTTYVSGWELVDDETPSFVGPPGPRIELRAAASAAASSSSSSLSTTSASTSTSAIQSTLVAESPFADVNELLRSEHALKRLQTLPTTTSSTTTTKEDQQDPIAALQLQRDELIARRLQSEFDAELAREKLRKLDELLAQKGAAATIVPTSSSSSSSSTTTASSSSTTSTTTITTSASSTTSTNSSNMTEDDIYKLPLPRISEEL